MKKILTLIFILGFSLCSFSQGNRDKIKTLKIAFITEKLNLSAKEAQAFWPVYNNFQENFYKLREELHNKRKNVNFNTISDKEAETLLKEIAIIESKKHNLKQNNVTNLLKVISAKKIILLDKVEDDFKRKMFEEYKNRRGS
jgi:hypothetical protein